MPNATVTLRELKNQETGLDLNIPSHREIPGLLGHTVEYQVVVVSCLSCFKTAAHKETDIVQFMIPKQLDNFEEFRKRLLTKTPGLQLPSLPRKGFTVLGDSHAKERRISVEKFLCAIAARSITAHSSTTLAFLGVNSITASSFSVERSKLSGNIPEQSSIKKSKSENLFGDEEEDDYDLFGDGSEVAAAGERPSNLNYSAQLFESTVSPMDPIGNTKLFDEQDLGGAVTHEEADLFLIHGAIDESIQGKQQTIELEDNSDLLNVEDDLDKILSVSRKSKSPTKPAVKPKPGVKPKIGPKPGLSPKPGQQPAGDGAAPAAFDASDIFKYIQENEQRQSEDLDLFS